MDHRLRRLLFHLRLEPYVGHVLRRRYPSQTLREVHRMPEHIYRADAPAPRAHPLEYAAQRA